MRASETDKQETEPRETCIAEWEKAKGSGSTYISCAHSLLRLLLTVSLCLLFLLLPASPPSFLFFSASSSLLLLVLLSVSVLPSAPSSAIVLPISNHKTRVVFIFVPTLPSEHVFVASRVGMQKREDGDCRRRQTTAK